MMQMTCQRKEMNCIQFDQVKLTENIGQLLQPTFPGVTAQDDDEYNRLSVPDASFRNRTDHA